MTSTLRPVTKCGNGETPPPPRVQAIRMVLSCLELSPWRLAKRLRCDKSTVKRWAAGETPVNLEILERDAEVALVFLDWCRQFTWEQKVAQAA